MNAMAWFCLCSANAFITYNQLPLPTISKDEAVEVK